MELNMSDFLLRLRLNDISFFLNSGHPPLIVQLVAVNLVLAIALVVGRMRRHPISRRKSTVVVQWLIIVSTFAMVSEELWLPYAQKSEATVVDQVGRVLQPY